jgi:SAM-dependent methyltransferase
VLDVGSSTRAYREAYQPYVEAKIFAPLRQAGLHLVHLDAKADEGVDVVCDVTDKTVDVGELLGTTFDAVLCANMLEHVEDREHTARVVRSLVAPGGYLLATVPQSYRRHLDPIDTMYRPTPGDLVELLTNGEPSFRAVLAESVEIRERGAYQRHPSRIPLWGRREYLRYRLGPLRWRQACVMLRAG